MEFGVPGNLRCTLCAVQAPSWAVNAPQGVQGYSRPLAVDGSALKLMLTETQPGTTSDGGCALPIGTERGAGGAMRCRLLMRVLARNCVGSYYDCGLRCSRGSLIFRQGTSSRIFTISAIA